MTRSQRQLRRVCAQYGCEVIEGKKHLRVMYGGRQIAVWPRSLSDRGRGVKQLEGAIKRGVRSVKEEQNAK